MDLVSGRMGRIGWTYAYSSSSSSEGRKEGKDS